MSFPFLYVSDRSGEPIKFKDTYIVKIDFIGITFLMFILLLFVLSLM